jgi:hypothetical protein
MRPLRAVLFTIPLLALMFSQTGCLLAAAAAGTGAGVAYVKGKTVEVVDADPVQIADAAEATMRELGIAVISREASKVDAKIKGRTARDTSVDVTAKAETEKTSKVYVRVGVFGDDPLQARLLDGIKSHLSG